MNTEEGNNINPILTKGEREYRDFVELNFFAARYIRDYRHFVNSQTFNVGKNLGSEIEFSH